MLRITAATLALLGTLTTAADGAPRVWQDGLRLFAGGHPRHSELTYRVYLPENYTPNEEYPFVLYLHPNGQQGSDNVRQVSTIIPGLIDVTYAEHPAILVAPQAPTGTSWGTPSTLASVTTVIEETLSNFSVDQSRIHVTGVSMGGFGTIHYLEHFSQTEPGLVEFASASSLGAGTGYLGDLSETAPYDETPIWLLHGENDQTVDVSLSRDGFRSFTGLDINDPINFGSTTLGLPLAEDGNIRYTELPDAGHVEWVRDRAYSNSEFYDWMFSHSLQTIPEPSGLLVMAPAVIGLGGCRRRLSTARTAAGSSASRC